MQDRKASCFRKFRIFLSWQFCSSPGSYCQSSYPCRIHSHYTYVRMSLSQIAPFRNRVQELYPRKIWDQGLHNGYELKSIRWYKIFTANIIQWIYKLMINKTIYFHSSYAPIAERNSIWENCGSSCSISNRIYLEVETAKTVNKIMRLEAIFIMMRMNSSPSNLLLMLWSLQKL